MIYDFNQRVYLRSDPSQYGRIGVGMFGGNLDASGTCQFVFWEHEGADIETVEPIANLMDEAEFRERRRLFMHLMRQPEMKWLRESFKHLKYSQDIDWREIKELQVEPPCNPFRTPWSMTTDKFVTLLICPERYDGIEDFMTVPHHDENNLYCKCYYCYDATMHKYLAEQEQEVTQ